MRTRYFLPLLLLLTGCSQAPQTAPVSVAPTAVQPAVVVVTTAPEPTFPPVQIGPAPGATPTPKPQVKPVSNTRAVAPQNPAPAPTPQMRLLWNGNPVPPTPIPTPEPLLSPGSGFADGSTPARGIGILCNDGTYSYSATRQGACSHHGGIAGVKRSRSRRRW